MGHSHFKLYHPHLVPSNITKVADVINLFAYSGDYHLPAYCFSPVDAERISKIPLPPAQWKTN